MYIIKQLRNSYSTLSREFSFWRMKQKIVSSLKTSSANEERIIFIGSPLHGNLGDHAIALAIRKFFNLEFPRHLVIEIPGVVFSAYSAVLRNHVLPNDCVTVVGGGFLGTLWLNEEEMVRSVVRTFPRNRIVIFPQTVFFNASPEGYLELKKTQQIYRSHNDLHLFIRDDSIQFTRDELCGGFFTDVRSAPDMVFLLNRSSPKFNRSKALLCFRTDKEKVLPEGAIENLERDLQSKGELTFFTDTVISKSVNLENREFQVEKKLDEFRQSRLVITDRLHGMIFASITGTPCIAINNLSGKVKGVWMRWLSHLPYIKFVDDIGSIPPLLDDMLAMGGQGYNNELLLPSFKEIASTIDGKSL